MKKSKIMEMIGILSLSLVLTSSLAVSGTLPSMLKYFHGYSRASVETIISIPAVMMTIIIALTPFITRVFHERTITCVGLMMIGICGILPVFISEYLVVLASRVFLGIGIGLVNTRAVSMVGERFTGNLGAKLQGIRVSMESLGQTVLTLIAGQLLVFGWKSAYLIYLIAFVILLLYFLFVPKLEKKENVEQVKGKKNQIGKMTGKDWKITLILAVFAGLLVSTNVANSLRIPGHVVGNHIGSVVMGNNILSISVFMGFVGGLCFGKFFEKMKKWILPCFLCTTAVGLILIGIGNNILFVIAGVALCGFSITNCLSYVFNCLAASINSELLNTANAIVLVGCNLGASAAPYILRAVGVISSEVCAGFIAYAITFAAIAILVGILNIKRRG